MKANKKSWRIQPITTDKVALDIYAEYSEEEYKKISDGFVPSAMEEKWIIYIENNTLWFHRSWTGQCIYEVKFIKAGDKHIIKEAWANGLKNLDDVKKRDYWSKIVLFLINVILLGKNDAPPELDEHADNLAESFAYRFHMFGYQGVSKAELEAVAVVMQEIKNEKRK